jgi:hypothetical protein
MHVLKAMLLLLALPGSIASLHWDVSSPDVMKWSPDPMRTSFAFEDFVAPLRNSHIVMIGDSLMRYQYISLVYYLTTQRWSCEEPGLPNESEGAWKEVGPADGWPSYHYTSNRRLGCNEICDCFRGRGFDPGSGVRENRFWHDCALNISVSLFFWLPDRTPLLGRYNGTPLQAGLTTHPACEQCSTFRYPTTLTYDEAYEYSYMDILSFLRAEVPKLRPSMVMINSGAWVHHELRNNSTFTSAFGEALMASASGGVGVWKTTTVCRDCPVEQADGAAFTSLMTHHGVRVFDAYRLTSYLERHASGRAHVDLWHYQAFVYKEMNKAMVAQWACWKQGLVPHTGGCLDTRLE